MTHIRSLPIHVALAAAPFALLAFVACSSDAQRGTATEFTIAVPTTEPVATTIEPTTTAAPADTTPETLPPEPEPEPEPTIPPIPTIPPQIAPNPAECIDADIDAEPVELVITDFGVLYAGDDAPACLRVPESFAFQFTNNAEGDATIHFAEGEGVVTAGDSQLSDPLGEMFEVGETFQITIVELDTTITVEVTEAP